MTDRRKFIQSAAAVVAVAATPLLAVADTRPRIVITGSVSGPHDYDGLYPYQREYLERIMTIPPDWIRGHDLFDIGVHAGRRIGK